MADTVEERNPYVPDVPMLRRVNGTERIVPMPHFAMVEPTETSVAPRAYVLPAVPAAAPAPAPARPAGGAAASGAPPAGARGQGGPPPGMGGFGRGGGNPAQRVVQQRHRPPRGARREVHQDDARDDGQGRAIRHRAVHAGRAGVPRRGAAQAADADRESGSRPSRRIPAGLDHRPDGPAAGAPRVHPVRPAVGRRADDVEHPRRPAWATRRSTIRC